MALPPTNRKIFHFFFWTNPFPIGLPFPSLSHRSWFPKTFCNFHGCFMMNPPKIISLALTRSLLKHCCSCCWPKKDLSLHKWLIWCFHLNMYVTWTYLTACPKMNVIGSTVKFNNQHKVKCLAKSQNKATSLMWELAIALVF